MTAAVGHPTLRLVRIAIGPITLEGLEPGQWDAITAEEKRELRDGLTGLRRAANQWGLVGVLQGGVHGAERATAEEAAVRRQRRRVGRLKDRVAGLVDKCLFLPGVRAPEDEDDVLRLGPHVPDDSVREGFPAAPLVAGGLMSPDGECRVEHQHTLLRPWTQVAVCRWRDTEIGLEFPKDIDERRRKPDAVIHTEAETVCLPWTVVRILPEKHDPDVGEGGEMQGRETSSCGGYTSWAAAPLRRSP